MFHRMKQLDLISDVCPRCCGLGVETKKFSVRGKQILIPCTRCGGNRASKVDKSTPQAPSCDVLGH